MRAANTINADKYFPCMAHCQAASRGFLGMVMAYYMGQAREYFDQYGKGDSRKDCDEDREANRCGLRSRGDCQKGCSRYLPPSMQPQYRGSQPITPR